MSTMFDRTAPPAIGNISEAIGCTPLVKLNRVCSELKCQVYAKAEFMNAGGSIKDRIARRMFEIGLADGTIIPGKTKIVEPTSGNTGVGLALLSAVHNVKFCATMPMKMSGEKIAMLKALGADVVRTPNAAAFDDPTSHIGVAKRMVAEEGWVMLDQYSNPGNPEAHYEGTGVEILSQLKAAGLPPPSMFVAGAGTGGTIAGTARRLKEAAKEGGYETEVVGVDPHGSILAGPSEPVMYQVEGIGYDFIPKVLTYENIDRWLRSNDADSFKMQLRLIKEEGLMCGGSCGTAVNAVLEAAKDLGPDDICVVVLPDSISRYLTKSINPEWRAEKGFDF